MKIEVSIITPSFNSEHYITDTIESVINQTFQNWEMIIVDDCSNDNSVAIIEEYCLKDSRIKLFRLDENLGSGKVRNICIEKASGRYLAFLDSDDYWAVDKLEKQISFMKANNFVFTYTQYFEFQSTTGQVKTLIKCPDKVTYSMILRDGGYLGCLTVVYDTNFFGKRKMPEIRKRQDWALWIKMLKEIDCAHGILEPLAYYRTGNTSLSKNKIKLVKHNFMVYRKELGMSFFESFYRMSIFLINYFLFKPGYKIKVS